MIRRRRLPDRRAHEARDIIFQGQRFSVGIGRDDDGAPFEVFVGATKAGSGYDAIARDAGIVLSIALQSGAELATIGHALTRDHRGEPASLLRSSMRWKGPANDDPAASHDCRRP